MKVIKVGDEAGVLFTVEECRNVTAMMKLLRNAVGLALGAFSPQEATVCVKMIDAYNLSKAEGYKPSEIPDDLRKMIEGDSEV